METSEIPTQGVTTDREIDAPRRRLGPVTSTWRHCWSAAPWLWRVWALTTTLAVGIAAASGHVPVAAALTVAVAVPAAIVDVHEHRLPDGILVGAGAALLLGVVFTPTLGTATAVGALTMAGPLLVLHLWSPSSMGFGDVKTAAVLGGAAAMIEWELALVALTLAAGCSATGAVITHRRTIAFGPGLVTGAALALVFHPLLLSTTAEHPVTRHESIVAVEAS